MGVTMTSSPAQPKSTFLSASHQRIGQIPVSLLLGLAEPIGNRLEAQREGARKIAQQRLD